MSIPRITQILEAKTLDDAELKDVVMAWAGDVSENLDQILVELKKFNLNLSLFTGEKVDDEDVED